jgi:hypothetical protein
MENSFVKMLPTFDRKLEPDPLNLEKRGFANSPRASKTVFASRGRVE